MKIEELYKIFVSHNIISTDSRSIGEGSIFFALKGGNFDGNKFAEQALTKGAAYAVVDAPELKSTDNQRVIWCQDVLTTLQDLARYHREQLALPIIAITGSNGKTTTKELTEAVLSRKYRTYATRGNLNNHIGVPLTLLSMDENTQLGVVEMGASACHEIELLCSIAKPNYGIISNIGRAHLEGFGGEQGVKRGKGELLDYLSAHGGKAFIAEQNSTIREMAAERQPLETISYSYELANGLKHQLEGEYNRQNIAGAVAIGREFGVSDEQIRLAIEGYTPQNNRSQRVVNERNTIIVDCYNANPSSMEASIRNFLGEEFAYPSKLLILGDMLELGDWSLEEHTYVYKLAASQNNDIYTVGSNFGQALAKIATTNRRHFASTKELKEHLEAQPIRNHAILLKGSRGIGLEQVLELL